jgi:hypothetical protein
MNCNLTDIPTEVVIQSRSQEWEGPRSPERIRIGDQILDWSDAPVAYAGDQILLVDGLPYGWARSAGYRPHREGGWAWGSVYRLLIGWQVLRSTRALNQGDADVDMAPLARFPCPDRAEADRAARSLVTRNLASLNGHLRVALVWQDAQGLSEPIAMLDGRNHPRGEAVAAMTAGDWLEWDWVAPDVDEAGDAPTPPASESPRMEADHTHDTTEDVGEQIVLVVRYESHPAAVQPAQVFANGHLVQITDGAGNEVPPPAHSMAEIRLALQHQGYAPDYSAWSWLGRGDPPRRRREVWARHGNGHSEPEPAWDVPSLRTGPHAPVPHPHHSPAVLASMEVAAKRRANEDPSRPDPYWRETWTPGRTWDLAMHGIGG